MFWISSEPSARGEEFHYDLGAVRLRDAGVADPPVS